MWLTWSVLKMIFWTLCIAGSGAVVYLIIMTGMNWLFPHDR